MITLKIDNTHISVREGTTILKAAKQMGIEIPAMCFNEEAGPFTSCMVCMVKENVSGKLIPSCTAMVEEGMQIITASQEVIEARRTALELLLSDHVGDCQAPCQISCPAHMDIPQMNRLLALGKNNEALQVVLQDIPLPSILGRICPAPCEGACRRKTIDDPVSICLLKRFAGDKGQISTSQLVPDKRKNNHTITIIGAGPAGITAAYYLNRSGYSCTIVDRNEKPGGTLQYEVPENELPRDIVNKELNGIFNLGVKYKGGIDVNGQKFKEIVSQSNAVIIATGNLDDNVRSWGMDSDEKGLKVQKDSYQTNVPHVFAIGNVLRSSRLAVRSVGQGKEVAVSIQQYLEKKSVDGYKKIFNSRFGKLFPEEYPEYLKESVPGKQVVPVKGAGQGYNESEVQEEASRCMHCDCRDINTCKLRFLSDDYGANQKNFQTGTRKLVSKKYVHDTVIYEPGKCIKCGICVRLTEKYKEEYGFTFIGRGFDVQIGIPFDKDLKSSLSETAEKIANACPTGALSKY